MAMNPKVKEKWVAALESGEYQQTRHILKRTDAEGNSSYCCFGVLCELAVAEGAIPADSVAIRPIYDGASETMFDYGYALPPGSVIDWAGLSDGFGAYGGTEGDYSLVNMNDAGKPFAEIAKVIREKF